MRIIVWGINYAPEITGIGPHNAALCEFLKSSGHDVRMLTTFSYYPSWRKLPADCGRIYRTDQVNGIEVHRCWHFVPCHASNWKRIFHEMSFILTSMLRFLTLKRPDLIIVVSPPLLIGAAAWLGGILKGVPFVFHVQDLQPDGAVGLGMLKQSVFTRLLYGLEAFVYRKAYRVSGISRGMTEAFSKKEVPVSRQIYFPNTIVVPKPEEIPALGQFRANHGFSPTDFLAVHSGNVGIKHGLHVLVEAACLIKNKRIQLLVCGEGTARSSLEELIKRHALKNVLLLPLQSESEYRSMLVDADICLIMQQKGSGRSFFPSKLLNALAYSRPVMAVTDSESELSRVIGEGNFGVVVPHDDPKTLAGELERLAADPHSLAEFGGSGRTFVAQYDRELVFRNFAAAISQDAT